MDVHKFSTLRILMKNRTAFKKAIERVKRCQSKEVVGARPTEARRGRARPRRGPLCRRIVRTWCALGEI